MQGNRFFQGMRRVYARYDQFMEKQGFYIVLALCVMIIAASALYTFHFRDQWDSGGEPADAQTVGGSQQAQTLAQAQQLVESQQQLPSVPTQPPARFVQPLDGRVERDFSLTNPQFFAVANAWQVHPGIDIQAEYGALVKACGAGKVEKIWRDNAMGLCVRLSHADGYESVYAGLSETLAIQAGDPVAQGQSIGQVGDGVLAESDEQTHLHFEIWRGGAALDPIEVFLGIDNGNPS